MAIEVDQWVFAPSEKSRNHCNESVIVVGAADPGAAAMALRRAGGRFMAVAENGREFSEEDADEVGEEDLYTPNYVSEVRMAPRGPWLYLDCKGWIAPPMRDTLVAILVEELDRAGVSGRVEVPAAGEKDYDTPPITP